MIGERTGVLGSGARRTAGHRLTGTAVAGRERFSQAFNGSILVQLMLAMSFVAVAALLYLAQASQASILQVNIDALKTDRMQLTSQNGNLHAVVGGLQSPTRIEAAAAGQLHMTQDGPAIWVDPVAPPVSLPREVNADTLAAQQDSQPLAWLKNAFDVVKSSL